MTPSLREASGPAFARMARALWAAWAVLALELGIALAIAGRELASVWEVQYGLLWLAPTALVLAGLAALLGLLAAWLVEHSEVRAVRGLLLSLIHI